METINNILNFLKGLKHSLFLTITTFIIGIVVPGACSLAIYDIDLFIELDAYRLTLLSIGISSPAMLISMLKHSNPATDSPDINSIEPIFFFSGFISITVLFLIVAIEYISAYFLNSGYPIPIEVTYLLSYVIWIIPLTILNLIKNRNYKKNQRNTQPNNETSIPNEQST